MKIDERTIEIIEKALDFKLYQAQKDYLMHDTPLQSGRASGKTLAHCIKLALSEGEPLNTYYPEEFCDDDYGRRTNKERYAKYYYNHVLREVRELLSDAGLPIREVMYKRRVGILGEGRAKKP